MKLLFDQNLSYKRCMKYRSVPRIEAGSRNALIMASVLNEDTTHEAAASLDVRTRQGVLIL